MEKTFTGKSQEEANYRAYKWIEDRGSAITNPSVVAGSVGANDPTLTGDEQGLYYTYVTYKVSNSSLNYTVEPEVIAIGHLIPEGGDTPLYFKLYQLADDTIEFQFGAGGRKWVIKVNRINGYDVTLAIEKTMGGKVTIDYEHSKLKWS
jgi:hypothetical protein